MNLKKSDKNKIMNTRRIVRTIATILCFIAPLVIIVACDNEQGMMPGSSMAVMTNWNWGQIIIGLGIGILIGFLLGLVFIRRKK